MPTEFDLIIEEGYEALEALDGVSITYTEVDADGTRTDVSTTALVEDLPDTGDEVRQKYALNLDDLSRQPARMDEITDADGNVWTVRDIDLNAGNRVVVEVSILQVRG